MATAISGFFPVYAARRGHILLGPVQRVWTSYLPSQRSVSMAGIVLFIWVISTSTRLRRHGLIPVWALVVLLGFLQPWFTQHRKYTTAELPAGRSAIERSHSEKLNRGIEHITPGELLFQASWPGLYLPLGVRNPVFLDTASVVELRQHPVQHGDFEWPTCPAVDVIQCVMCLDFSCG